jgi:hypothetical protein
MTNDSQQTKHHCCSHSDNNKKFLKSIRKDALRNFSFLVEAKLYYSCNIDKYKVLASKTEEDIESWSRIIGNDISDMTDCSSSHYQDKNHNWRLVYEYNCPENCTKNQYRKEKNIKWRSKCCNSAVKTGKFTLRCKNCSYDSTSRRRNEQYCNQRIDLELSKVVTLSDEECLEW